jgi:autotransporter-associated beta strand protein
MLVGSSCSDLNLSSSVTLPAPYFTARNIIGTSYTATIPTGATLQLGCGNATGTTSAILAGAGGLKKIGTGAITLTATNTYTGNTTITGGTLQVGNGGTTGTLGTGNVVNNATLAFNRTDATTVANTISGTGALTQAGAGTLTLSGANTYTGATNFNAGVLNAGSVNAIGATGTLFFNGGILQYSANNQTDYSGRLSAAGNQNIKIDLNGQNITYAADIAGAATGITVMDGSSTLPAVTAGTVSTSPNYGPTSGGVLTTVTYPDNLRYFVDITTSRSTGLNFYGLTNDGWVYGWGANTSGALGVGNTTAYTNPVPMLRGAIPAGVTIKQIAALGLNGLIMLGSDGWVYTVGNYYGLGNGTTSGYSSTPVAISQGAIPAGVKITQIAADYSAVIALGDNGWAYTWGQNTSGVLGTGNTTNSFVPVAVQRGAVPAGVKAVFVAIGNTGHMIADNGKIYSWGNNASGALGTGNTTTSNTPVQTLQGDIPTTATPIFLETNNYVVSVLCNNGWVYSWGRDSNSSYSYLGIGTTVTPKTSPVAISQGDIPAGVTVAKLSVGSNHSHIIASNGKLYGWGINNTGQIGTGGTDITTKVPKSSIQGSIPTNVTPIKVVAGTTYTLILGSDGKIYKTGAGNPSSTNSFALTANFAVSSITFDGSAGTNLSNLSATTSTITTPAHAVGPVDVVVSYSVYQNTTLGSTYTTATGTGAYVYIPSFTLSGVNSFTGGVNVNANAVVVSASATALGTGNININSGGILFLNTNNTSTATINVNAGGILNMGGNTFAGTIVNNGGTVNL